MKYDSENDGPPTHLQGYADLKLIADQKFKQESKYVRDTLNRFTTRRYTHGAPYLSKSPVNR